MKMWLKAGASGTNRTLGTDQLEQALGDERVQWLIDQTGMSKQELLAGLSSILPGVVDKFTPNGHVPTNDELARHLSDSSGATP